MQVYACPQAIVCYSEYCYRAGKGTPLTTSTPDVGAVSVLRGAVAGLRDIKRAVAGIADSLTAARAARCDQLLRQLGDVEASAHRLAFICEADQRCAQLTDAPVLSTPEDGAGARSIGVIHSVNAGDGPTPADCAGWWHQCIPGRDDNETKRHGCFDVGGMMVAPLPCTPPLPPGPAIEQTN
jgi:hypothetical protein